MTASITATGFNGVTGMLLQARSGKLQKELVDMLHESADDLVVDIRGAAYTRIERRAATTVVARRSAKGVEVTGGRGGGLGAVLFAGGEFGGRASKKRLVRGYVFGRGSGFVNRRVTMMFKPHLGTEGYFFWVSVRNWLPDVREDTTKVVESFVNQRTL